MIIYKNIAKKYADITLKIPFFEFSKGQVTGIYNSFNSSAEKIIELLAGVRTKDTGTISIDEAPDYKKLFIAKVAYLSNTPQIYDELTVEQLFKFHARYLKISSQNLKQFVNRCNNLFFLPEVYTTRVEKLNSEVKMMINFLVMILYSPDYLFWNEPFAYFNLEIMQKIIEFCHFERGKKFSIMLSSHDYQKLKYLCSKVLTVKKGELIDSSII